MEEEVKRLRAIGEGMKDTMETRPSRHNVSSQSLWQQALGPHMSKLDESQCSEGKPTQAYMLNPEGSPIANHSQRKSVFSNGVYFIFLILFVILFFYVLVCFLTKKRKKWCGLGWVERIWEEMGKRKSHSEYIS